MPTFWQRAKLEIQFMMFLLPFLFIYPAAWIYLFVFRRYSLSALKTIRQQFKTISAQSKAPLLICANHLTLLDPFLLFFALGSFWYYLTHPYAAPWNLPNVKYVRKNCLYRCLFYLSKTLPVDRNASVKRIKQTMQKMTYLLTHRHHVQIFPEGTRSKSGRINQEKFTRGAGQLLRKAPDTRVLCVYLRGHSQKASSDFPPQGENFFCALKSIAPQTAYTGLQADRDLTAQIMHALAQMEQAYFSQSAFV